MSTIVPYHDSVQNDDLSVLKPAAAIVRRLALDCTVPHYQDALRLAADAMDGVKLIVRTQSILNAVTSLKDFRSGVEYELEESSGFDPNWRVRREQVAALAVGESQLFYRHTEWGQTSIELFDYLNERSEGIDYTVHMPLIQALGNRYQYDPFKIKAAIDAMVSVEQHEPPTKPKGKKKA